MVVTCMGAVAMINDEVFSAFMVDWSRKFTLAGMPVPGVVKPSPIMVLVINGFVDAGFASGTVSKMLLVLPSVRMCTASFSRLNEVEPSEDCRVILPPSPAPGVSNTSPPDTPAPPVSATEPPFIPLFVSLEPAVIVTSAPGPPLDPACNEMAPAEVDVEEPTESPVWRTIPPVVIS